MSAAKGFNDLLACGSNYCRFRRILFVLLVIACFVYLQLFLHKRYQHGKFSGLGSRWRLNHGEDESNHMDDDMLAPAPHQITSHDNAIRDVNRPLQFGARWEDDTFEPGEHLTKEMMKHAWSGYKKYAWGYDELLPLSQNATNVYGNDSLCLSMIDALDTLLIMGFQSEYEEAKDYIVANLNFDKDINIPLAEGNTRILGGLLSSFAMNMEGRLVSLAFDYANRYISAFRASFPNRLLKLTMVPKVGPDATADNEVATYPLASAGSFTLELAFLSKILGNPIFRDMAYNSVKEASQMTTSIPGLYPSELTLSKKQANTDYTLGQKSHAFYQYLYKYWHFAGQTDLLHERMFNEAFSAITKNLIIEEKGATWLISRKNGEVVREVEHEACYAGGLFILASKYMSRPEMLKVGVRLVDGCYNLYRSQSSKLGAEISEAGTALWPKAGHARWNQGFEVVESLFIAWRVTREVKYRQWGYEIAKNIEKHCRVATGGYAGIEDMLASPMRLSDRQFGHFMGGTLKYLYLLFASDSVLPIGEYAFNAMGHPLPVLMKDQVPAVWAMEH